MPEENHKSISRRALLRLAAAGFLTAPSAAGPFFLFPLRAQEKRKTLKILQWNHPVPAYDEWFDAFARQWSEKNDTNVLVDHVPAYTVRPRAQEEVSARAGHDLTMFLSPPATFENHVIDHQEIYQQVQARHGQVIPLAHKSTFNPETKKFFAFSDCYMPATTNWLIRPWASIGYVGGPVDYLDLRWGAREIRKQFGIPCGIGLGDTLEAGVAMQSLLWSFGGRVHDAAGKGTLNSWETVEALKYMTELFRQSETPAMLQWGPADNVRALVSAKASFTVNAIFLTRGAEKENPAAAREISINTALRGPYNWLACPHVTSCYVVWEFARNKEGAKKFLVDLMDNYRAAFNASGYCNLPSFPSLAPDLLLRITKDPNTRPPHKYMALEDSLHWTQNLGYPGYATAPVCEVFESYVVPRMFARAAKGELSPEDAAKTADREAAQIFAKWEQAGKS